MIRDSDDVEFEFLRRLPGALTAADQFVALASSLLPRARHAAVLPPSVLVECIGKRWVTAVARPVLANFGLGARTGYEVFFSLSHTLGLAQVPCRVVPNSAVLGWIAPDRCLMYTDADVVDEHISGSMGGSFLPIKKYILLPRQKLPPGWSAHKVSEQILADSIPKCRKCDGLVKPDIVFFGESLPLSFMKRLKTDFPKCDLLIILGTSLVVQPFASLVDKVRPTVPRLLINREKAGITPDDPLLTMLGISPGGLQFDSPSNYRDVFWQGDCDTGCRELARLVGRVT
ncbi:sirtuin 1 [Pelomyxa schiedti]|nr:sirtuin 1 [Pelomyxa schiedti]